MWPFRRKHDEDEDLDIFAKARKMLSVAPPKAPAKTEPSPEALERDVRELYSEPDGSIPDLTKLERGRSHRLRNLTLAAIAVLAALAAAAWGGIAVFGPSRAWTPEDFALTVDSPQSARSGEETTFTVRYRNSGPTDLSGVDLTMNMPDGFEFRRSDPEASAPGEWKIGDLAPGASGTIRVTGRVLAAPGSLMDLKAFVDYLPADFNSPFQTVATGAFTVVGATLGLTATSTDRVMPGEPVEVVYSWRNDGSEPMDDAALRVNFPQGFVFSNSSPGATVAPSLWKLGTVAPGSDGKVVIRGSFDSGAKGEEDFAADLGYMKGEDFVAQDSTSTPVTVIGGDLVITTFVNGSSDASPVDFGDTLHVSVSYANKSEAQLGNVSLKLDFAGDPTDQDGKGAVATSSIADAAGGTVVGDSIVWTSKEVPALAKLQPGDQGTFDVSLKLAQTPYAPGVKDYSLALWVEGTVGTVNGAAKGRQVTSSKLVFPFFSDLAFTAESRYFNDDDEAVGTGPLPPKAGEETTYRIFWTITNALHELDGITVKTTLPDDVRFTGKSATSAGELQYDADKKEVSWVLNRLPTSVGKATMDFEVGLTPSDAAVGNILPLTGSASLDAMDTVAGGHIVRTADAVDTSLVGDPLGRGKGVVAK